MDRQIDILFVDDQWCRPAEQSTIVAAFGRLMRHEVPYVFHYETAEVGRGRYGVEPVLQKIHAIPGLLYFRDRLAIPHVSQVVKKEKTDRLEKGARIISAGKFLSGLI